MRRPFVTFVVIVASVVSVHAAILNPSDCSRSQVQNAIDRASDGDTIQIPAGTCTWTGTITVTKGVQIIGAGVNATTIIDNAISGGTWTLSSTHFTRLSGFTLSGTAGSYNGSVRIKANNKRVDNIRFNFSNDRHAIGVNGNLSNVVIDHCVFDGLTRGVNIFGSTSYWTDNSQYVPGSSYGVYIEDSIFNRGGVEVVDLNYGGAYVVRYSSIRNGGNLTVHGADSGSRSGGYVEIYNNEFINPGSTKDMAVVLRGGSAIIFNNTITGPYNQAFKLQNWRTSYGLVNLPFHTDNRNRCQSNSSNSLDGDYSPDNNGWPCKDQIGRGPNHLNAPLYEWNNTWDKGAADFRVDNLGDVTNPSAFDHIREGRDYFKDTPKPGYTPYPYPHPLVADDGSPSLPAPPTALRVVQ